MVTITSRNGEGIRWTGNAKCISLLNGDALLSTPRGQNVWLKSTASMETTGTLIIIFVSIESCMRAMIDQCDQIRRNGKGRIGQNFAPQAERL